VSTDQTDDANDRAIKKEKREGGRWNATIYHEDRCIDGPSNATRREKRVVLQVCEEGKERNVTGEENRCYKRERICIEGNDNASGSHGTSRLD